MENSSFWEITVPRVMSVYANVIFLVLWAGFAVALFVNRAWLDILWGWVQSLPAIPKIIVWVVFLPVLVGLWIWESTWSPLGRLLGIAGIVAWNLLALSSFYKAFRLT